MSRVKNLLRAFIGFRAPLGTPILPLDRLLGEWRRQGIKEQHSYTESYSDGSHTVRAIAVLDKPSLWTHPARSWKQRLENYRTLKRGTVRFFGNVWDPVDGMVAVVTKRGFLDLDITNLSRCCWEPMTWNNFVYGCDPPLYGIRCSKCNKQWAASDPNVFFSDDAAYGFIDEVKT